MGLSRQMLSKGNTMKKFLVVSAALLTFATGANAQQVGTIGPNAPCTAFGTTSGTCIQGAGAGGTPSAINLTNGTALPVAGISGLGTGVGTALGVNVGTAGSPVVNGGALGTPSSGVGTNITGVNAATLGGATFAAPAAIGTGTPAAGTFTTITGTSASPTWTPSDTSGAALSLTVGTSTYSRVGNMIFAVLSVTYPVTADGSNASIGGLPVNNALNTNVGCSVAVNSVATSAYASVQNGAANIIFFALAGTTRITNAQLSTGTIEINCAYPAT